MTSFRRATALVLAAALAGSSAAQTVTPVADGASGRALPMRVMGRAKRGATTLRQWPGTYFETAFRGSAVLFRVGTGDAALRVTVDDRPAVPIPAARAGFYRVAGLAAGVHRVRVQVADESQSGPTGFVGFFAPAGTRAATIERPRRQIEFIGDSHTVGYGNLSRTRECTEAQVRETTDTSVGIAGLLGRRYRADVQVNAISGRGVVRNYNGFSAPTLPQAYPFVLFDRAERYADPAWRPEVIVIALGTNDFTTPLHAGEVWTSRAQLHADYENRYVAFVRMLRALNPRASFLLWATDMANGEIEAEVGRVAERLRREGERGVAFVPVRGLAFAGCHSHPDVKDDRTIAAALAGWLDAHPRVWSGRPVR